MRKQQALRGWEKRWQLQGESTAHAGEAGETAQEMPTEPRGTMPVKQFLPCVRADGMMLQAKKRKEHDLTMQKRNISPEMLLFFIMISAAALGNGLSDSVYSNYFKEAYNVTTTQRAFIEFPREMPGLLCALVIASLSMLGDARISLIAQIASCTGLMALGLFYPVLCCDAHFPVCQLHGHAPFYAAVRFHGHGAS